VKTFQLARAHEFAIS